MDLLDVHSTKAKTCLNVIIGLINWNGLKDSIECIDSILNSDDLPHKILIWDNNSSNAEFDALSDLYENNPLIKVIKSEVNLGFTKASNELITIFLAGQSEYLVLLNNDTVVKADWLTNLVNHANGNSSKLLSCRMLDYYNRNNIDNLGLKILTNGEILPIKSDNKAQSKLMGTCGGAMLISREVLNELGVFDPFFNTGYEDAEYGLRAYMRGIDSLYCSDAVVYHKGGSSIKKIFNEKFAIREQVNILYTVFKLFPLLILCLLLPFILIRSVLILIVSLIFGKIEIFRILLSANKEFYFKTIKLALKKRKDNNYKFIISDVRLVKKFSSSILFDLKRFSNSILKNNPSALEQY